MRRKQCEQTKRAGKIAPLDARRDAAVPASMCLAPLPVQVIEVGSLLRAWNRPDSHTGREVQLRPEQQCSGKSPSRRMRALLYSGAHECSCRSPRLVMVSSSSRQNAVTALALAPPLLVPTAAQTLRRAAAPRLGNPSSPQKASKCTGRQRRCAPAAGAADMRAAAHQLPPEAPPARATVQPAAAPSANTFSWQQQWYPLVRMKGGRAVLRAFVTLAALLRSLPSVLGVAKALATAYLNPCAGAGVLLTSRSPHWLRCAGQAPGRVVRGMSASVCRLHRIRALAQSRSCCCVFSACLASANIQHRTSRQIHGERVPSHMPIVHYTGGMPPAAPGAPSRTAAPTGWPRCQRAGWSQPAATCSAACTAGSLGPTGAARASPRQTRRSRGLPPAAVPGRAWPPSPCWRSRCAVQHVAGLCATWTCVGWPQPMR